MRDFDGGLHLAEFALRDAHVDAVLGALDLREDLRLAGLQLGALHVVLGVIRLMASASSVMRCEALVCTISLSAVRTLVVFSR